MKILPILIFVNQILLFVPFYDIITNGQIKFQKEVFSNEIKGKAEKL